MWHICLKNTDTRNSFDSTKDGRTDGNSSFPCRGPATPRPNKKRNCIHSHNELTTTLTDKHKCFLWGQQRKQKGKKAETCKKRLPVLKPILFLYLSLFVIPSKAISNAEHNFWFELPSFQLCWNGPKTTRNRPTWPPSLDGSGLMNECKYSFEALQERRIEWMNELNKNPLYFVNQHDRILYWDQDQPDSITHNAPMWNIPRLLYGSRLMLSLYDDVNVSIRLTCGETSHCRRADCGAECGGGCAVIPVCPHYLVGIPAWRSSAAAGRAPGTSGPSGPPPPTTNQSQPTTKWNKYGSVQELRSTFSHTKSIISNFSLV